MDIGYAAGFFDGEGCINITRPQKEGGPRLQVVLTQKDRGPLDEFRQAFGGKIHPQTEDGGARIWQLRLYGRQAADFLRQIEPLLRLKREQARNALEFETLRAAGRRYYRTPADIKAGLELCYRRLQQLSSRAKVGEIPSSAPLPAADQMDLLG